MSNSSYVHRCSMQNNCTISADTSLFTDPCPGTLKYLEAHYRCVSSGKWISRCCPQWFRFRFSESGNYTDRHLSMLFRKLRMMRCVEIFDFLFIYFFWDQIKYIFILFLQNQTQYFSHLISMGASKIYHLPFRRYSARA